MIPIWAQQTKRRWNPLRVATGMHGRISPVREVTGNHSALPVVGPTYEKSQSASPTRVTTSSRSEIYVRRKLIAGPGVIRATIMFGLHGMYYPRAGSKRDAVKAMATGVGARLNRIQ